tara:strand:- start:112 stop:516 length:405 start_codon:yes stop_codon:yes gene_type:complete
MTTKPESNFGREIVKNISAQWTRIENRHGGGIPDIYGIKGGVSIWLELKCIRINSINISPLQISWNYKHFQESGKNYFFVKHIEQRTIKLYDGDKGRELKRDGFRVPCIVELSPPYDWQGLGDQLFNENSILHT